MQKTMAKKVCKIEIANYLISHGAKIDDVISFLKKKNGGGKWTLQSAACAASPGNFKKSRRDLT
jgi:hypothetical protein